jgi:hypothetical protein
VNELYPSQAAIRDVDHPEIIEKHGIVFVWKMTLKITKRGPERQNSQTKKA